MKRLGRFQIIKRKWDSIQLSNYCNRKCVRTPFFVIPTKALIYYQLDGTHSANKKRGKVGGGVTLFMLNSLCHHMWGAMVIENKKSNERKKRFPFNRQSMGDAVRDHAETLKKSNLSSGNDANQQCSCIHFINWGERGWRYFFGGSRNSYSLHLQLGKGKRDVCLIIVGDAFFFASAIP